MSELDDIALSYGTDKSSSHHNYTEVYDLLLGPRRGVVRSLIEIGVGGKSYKGKPCASLQMWRDWLPEATVVGIDNDPTVCGDYGERLRIVIGDQTSRGALDAALGLVGRTPDIVIDDGSHVNRLTIATFEYLWPHISWGGVYIIEDTQCSYTIPVFGNERAEFDQFLLRLVHSVDINGRKVTPMDAASFETMGDFVLNGYESTIHSVQVFRGLIFVWKRRFPIGGAVR